MSDTITAAAITRTPSVPGAKFNVKLGAAAITRTPDKPGGTMGTTVTIRAAAITRAATVRRGSRIEG